MTLLHPHGMDPTRLFCLWGFPGRNTGVGCHFFLQGIFSTQGLNRTHVSCIGRQVLYHWATREALYLPTLMLFMKLVASVNIFLKHLFERGRHFTLLNKCSVSALCPRHFAGHWRWSREDLVPQVTIMQCGAGTDRSRDETPQGRGVGSRLAPAQ